MKNLFKIIIVFFIVSRVFAAELEFTYTGKDEYPFFEEYEKGKMFMLYKNEGQFVTNTTLFGTQFAAASIEMIDGRQTQNLFAIVFDSHGNKGYVKSVPTAEKQIKGNMLGNKVGTSVGSFKIIAGEGPWKYLVGIKMRGVYYSMGKGHFIWKGGATIPDDNFKKIDSYIHNANEKSVR